jgi:hypothetical protein
MVDHNPTTSEPDPPQQRRSTEEILKAGAERDIQADARDRRANDRDAQSRLEDFVVGGQEKLSSGGDQIRDAKADRLAAGDDRRLSAYDREEQATYDESESTPPA